MASLWLAACGGTNDSDKNGDGDAGGRAGTAGTSSSTSGSNAGGTSANGAGGSGATDGGFECTTTAEPSELIEIPAGEFAMGCNEEADSACDDDEMPQHMVTRSTFSIERTEVSQAQYTACVLDGACAAPLCDWNCDNGDHPAGCIDSSQAKAYCAWAERRLPTEAEWEKAARGTEALVFPWGDAKPDCALANLSGCGNAAKPVDSLEEGASPYGVLHMAGNMVEMVSDLYDAGYYESSPATDPTGPDTGERYVGRGGGFKSEASWVRASKRDWYDPTDYAASLGFRCAR